VHRRLPKVRLGHLLDAGGELKLPAINEAANRVEHVYPAVVVSVVLKDLVLLFHQEFEVSRLLYRIVELGFDNSLLGLLATLGGLRCEGGRRAETG